MTPRQDMISLFSLKEGCAATVVKIDKHSRTLNAMGILPGMKIVLLKKNPAHLIRMSHTKIAIDNEVAKRIFVAVIDKKRL